jgi:hypothetical protein
MNVSTLSAALAALCFALPATAQALKGAAASSQRAETRMMVYTEDFKQFAMASITHGQPEWKAEYDNQIDTLKGKVNRLGKDWWTTLITSSDFEIGGTTLPAGSYVVGLHCDQDGKFALAFMDSTAAMKKGVTPFTPDWKPEHTAPMTLNKGTAKDSVAKMTMTMEADKATAGKGTLTIAWGKHTLTAPVMLHAPKK